MKILLTGANGYIGAILLQRLIKDGHFIYALVRNQMRFSPPPHLKGRISVIEGDILDPQSFKNFPTDFEAAYYLIHSMSHDSINFDVKDRLAAENFLNLIKNSSCKQIIYLSGIVNDEKLSKHLNSRYEIEKIFKKGPIPLTCLRAPIIIGAGSSSFEIIRSLVEKLPIMITPKWLNSKCQPIAVFDVIDYLAQVLDHPKCSDRSFDIGGPDRMSYKDILLKFAQIRKLKRYTLSIPILTPGLSTKWLFLITPTTYKLATALVDSLRNDVICINQAIEKIIPKKCLTYEQSVRQAFQFIEDCEVISSWKDSWSGSNMSPNYNQYLQMPVHGCLFLVEKFRFDKRCDCQKFMEQIYHLSGENGYLPNWAWKMRGFVDRLLGGVGSRGINMSRKKPRPGDSLDFWRVLLVDDENKRFLLFAEMKLPGEAWLEFSINEQADFNELIIKVTFRPRGVLGRVYWYGLWPIRHMIFKSLGKRFLEEAELSTEPGYIF